MESQIGELLVSARDETPTPQVLKEIGKICHFKFFTYYLNLLPIKWIVIPSAFYPFGPISSFCILMNV